MCSPRPRGWSPGSCTRTWVAPVLPAPAGMVPPLPRRSRPRWSAPRARGDGPGAQYAEIVRAKCSRARGDGPDWGGSLPTDPECSPRPRGWSQGGDSAGLDPRVLPTPAGMVPSVALAGAKPPGAPRLRGWSLPYGELRQNGDVLPAPAGMVPRRSRHVPRHAGAPRAGGDGPAVDAGTGDNTVCFPRPREWSPQRARRTRAPRARGDGPVVNGTLAGQYVLPAPAGMVPWSRTGRGRRTSAPRAPRGWSRWFEGADLARGVLPAPAGMVPHSISRSASTRWGYPRPRGWSRRRTAPQQPGRVLPALAGMVPRATTGPWSPRRAPRARGDGPMRIPPAVASATCSPRLRGWSRVGEVGVADRAVLPAPAGMIPGL